MLGWDTLGRGRGSQDLPWLLMCPELRIWPLRIRVWPVLRRGRFSQLAASMWMSFLKNHSQQSDNPPIWTPVAMTMGKDFCIFMNNHSTSCSFGVRIAKYGKIVFYFIKRGNQTTLGFRNVQCGPSCQKMPHPSPVVH